MTHNGLFKEQLSKVSPEVKKEMEWSARIVDRIDCILKEKGITQRELSKKIGCNETQIVRWTRGFPNYTLGALAKLSVALDEDLISISKKQDVINVYKADMNRKNRYLSDAQMPLYGKNESNQKKRN